MKKLYIVGVDGSADEYAPSVELPLYGVGVDCMYEPSECATEARAFFVSEEAIAYRDELRKKWSDKYCSEFIRVYEVTI